MEGISLIEKGDIETYEIPCPCCHSKYTVELKNRPNEGLLITMESCEYGYVPTLYMKCEVCNVSFKTALISRDDRDDLEDGEQEDDTDDFYNDLNTRMGGGINVGF